MSNTINRTVGSMAATITQRRHRFILNRLGAGDEILVRDIADALKVSETTIRRDLQVLEQDGHLTRIHGGAAPLAKSTILPLAERRAVMRAEKERIAEAAVPLVQDLETVFVGGGTTMLAFAQRIAESPPSLCVTNMLDVAITLGAARRGQVVLLGGLFEPELRVTKGMALTEQLGRYQFDAVVSSTNAIHPRHGFLDHDEQSAFTRRQLCTLTDRHIVLADHTKFGRKSRFRTMPLGKVTDLVTDCRPEAAYVEALEAEGVDLHIADQG